MEIFILRENALSDNTLYKAAEGKIFKGGYIAIIKEYTFLNCWSDKETVKKFRNEKTLEKYLEKNYTDLEFSIFN